MDGGNDVSLEVDENRIAFGQKEIVWGWRK